LFKRRVCKTGSRSYDVDQPKSTGMEGDVISDAGIFRYQRGRPEPENKIIGHFTGTGVRSHFLNASKCGAMTASSIYAHPLWSK